VTHLLPRSLAGAVAALTLGALAGLPAAGAQAPAGTAAPPAGGSIRGRVHFADAAPRVAGRPVVSDLGGTPHPLVDRRRSVVYLDRVPQGAFEELPTTRPRIDQRNEQFMPRLLAITVGTTVDFPNSDTKFHNVFSFSKTHPFDLGRYPPAKTGSQRFDRPGLVRVFCDIHSHMSANIWVFSHQYFSVTDTDDRYQITRVPVGSYTLMLWSELGAAEPKRVTVIDGNVTEMDFQVGRAR
jgi:plastocyanin